MSDAAGVGAFLIEGDRSLHILFGSQSGNSEDLASKILVLTVKSVMILVTAMNALH